MIDKVRKFLFHLRVQSLYIKENQSMRILFSVCFIVIFVYVIIRQLTNTINPQDWNNWNPQNPVIPIFTYIHLPSFPVTGGRNPYECTIEGMREVEHQSERDYERKIV